MAAFPKRTVKQPEGNPKQQDRLCERKIHIQLWVTSHSFLAFAMCDCILEDKWVTLLASGIAYFGPQIPITSNDKCKSAVYHCMKSRCMYIYIYTGWWFQPIWKIWVSSDDYSIYIYRYSIIKSFGFESIPQQLNMNVIRGLVKRAYEMCTTSMERAQLLWNVRNSYETCATSMIYLSSQTLQKLLTIQYPYIYIYMEKSNSCSKPPTSVYIYIYTNDPIEYIGQIWLWLTKLPLPKHNSFSRYRLWAECQCPTESPFPLLGWSTTVRVSDAQTKPWNKTSAT